MFWIEVSDSKNDINLILNLTESAQISLQWGVLMRALTSEDMVYISHLQTLYVPLSDTDPYYRLSIYYNK